MSRCLTMLKSGKKSQNQRNVTALEFIHGDSYSGATEMPSAAAEFNAYLTDSSGVVEKDCSGGKQTPPNFHVLPYSLPWHTPDICRIRAVVQSKWKSDNENKKLSSS